MKRLLLVMAGVIFAVMGLASCAELLDGGTIVVDNKTTTTQYITIVKGLPTDVNLLGGNLYDDEVVEAKKSKSFKVKEDGTYTVFYRANALLPVVDFKTVIMVLGGSKEITID